MLRPAESTTPSIIMRRRPSLTPLTFALLPLFGASLATAQTAAAPPAAAASAAPADSKPDSRPATRPQPAKPEPKAEVKTEQLNRVEVSGGASESAQRRASTASKIIIGREDIERFGDASVAETLKRLPGVTTGGRPGRGGAPRMRGMGAGYTQVLVNGERMPAGFSLDDLPPEQVERIEVMRAPTAEFGARAVAGTINIVLREALVKRNNDLRVGTAYEKGLWSPQFSWTRNDTLGEEGSGHAYTTSVVANRSSRMDDVDTRTTTLNLQDGSSSRLQQTGRSENTRDSLNLNARVQLRLDGGNTLNFMPILVAAQGKSSSAFTQVPGRDYDQVQTEGDNQFRMGRLNGMWMQRLSDSSRLELRGGIGQAQLDSSSLRQEWRGTPGALLLSKRQDDTTDSLDRSWNLASKFSHQLEASEHSLVGGLEAEGVKRDQTRISLVNGQPRPELADFGDELQASTLRLAAYAQDEFQISKQWSAYAGLRWEGIRTSSDAANYAVRNNSSVWTPLFHTVWKPDEKSRDQVRVSLTRSYRAPDVQNLIARPTINSQYELDPDTGSYPDRAGNPNLKPELATGIDLAFERYLSKGGVLSVSTFARRITDLIRNVTALETVSWSDTPRWVSRPRNIGNATTYGIELEAKFRLDEFFDDALPVSLRSNLSLFRSSVDGVPGPNNRLDQQPKATANLGADYRMRGLPLSFGGNLNWTPATTVQQTPLLASSSSRKLVGDAFVLWNINRDIGLRIAASNIAPLDYSSSSVITTSKWQTTTESAGRTFTNWQARLEIKL